jgi:acyl-coenzyme A thioesterase PaaI-like protein
VHGGVIAEVFDEVLGAANMVAGNPAMTGTLTVRYRKPTPLRTDLRIEARCLGRDGRKIRTWAAMYHEDLMTAEAEGIFIEVGPERFVAIAEGNVDSADPVMLEAMRAEAARPGAASDVPGWPTPPGTYPT